MHAILGGRLGLLSLLVVPGIVLAQDPTDITIWPACAVRERSILLSVIVLTDASSQQRCIPLGYSVCSSLADLDCICKNGDFTLALADCEQSTCLLPEKRGTFSSHKKNPPLPIASRKPLPPQVHPQNSSLRS